MKTAVHRTSQSWPTERRDPEAKVLKTCAFIDASGKFGSGNVAIFIECMNSPLGSRTRMDGLVFDSSLVGREELWLSRKFPVAPVSAFTSVGFLWAGNVLCCNR